MASDSDMRGTRVARLTHIVDGRERVGLYGGEKDHSIQCPRDIVRGVPGVVTEKSPTPHFNNTAATWNHIRMLIAQGSVNINGRDLDIATVVAVAKYDSRLRKNPQLLATISSSQDVLMAQLKGHKRLYGINTGFGGNADLDTNEVLTLQRALIQHQQSAILTVRDLRTSVDQDGETCAHSLPSSWTKSAMLIRCNTIIRGHSAVSLHLADTLIEFVRQDMTPIVPARGSISASGDLMPMSYIAGALQGNPDIFVRIGHDDDFRILDSQKAFEEIQSRYEHGRVKSATYGAQGRDIEYTPITLGPKEGLALVNGTAPSTAIAALAIHEANRLVILSQLITCLTSEALSGNIEWTHAYIADVRPHGGQAEVSQNQRSFFEGSKLVTNTMLAEQSQTGMAQDRYSIRTTSQWIGPLLEDLLHSSEQIKVELNSTTDNPIINPETGDIHCGGNFQATSVTMVAEKVRLCLQLIGKMLFTQTSELINSSYSNGLPPNLAADDPSLSFCMKGVDINMAAYQSELAFLANPISTHVQSAEMHNQGLNSLAMVSARYTMQCVELVQIMSAAAIYVGLQGVDLRVMHQTFLSQFEKQANAIVRRRFEEKVTDDMLHVLTAKIWQTISETWYLHAKEDADRRCELIAKATVEPMLSFFARLKRTDVVNEVDIRDISVAWKDDLKQTMYKFFVLHRSKFFEQPTTLEYLGAGTKALYSYVRTQIGVPFHRGRGDEPIFSKSMDVRQVKTIGSWISTIYEAIRIGEMTGEVLMTMSNS